MKQILALFLVLSVLLTGCSLIPARTTAESIASKKVAAETTAPPTVEPETEPETEPPTEPATEPAPLYTNPLNGKPMDTPYEGRIIACTISNIRGALPHYGTMQADILMEMWVNGSIIRDIALFTDPAAATKIGSIRSDRLMFNQIAQQYDMVILDALGSDTVLADAHTKGVDRISIDVATSNPEDASFRDPDREFQLQPDSKYEHTLFANGAKLKDLIESKGMSVMQSADKDYFLHFVEDGTPADGSTANKITVTFTYSNNRKNTSMVYNADLGKYVYNQYEKEMYDGSTGEPEAFNNVIVMLANIQQVSGGYYQANFPDGGTGYYACGGKLVPITWSADDTQSPFRFFTEDGAPLNMNIGNTYIAIAPLGSPVVFE